MCAVHPDTTGVFDRLDFADDAPHEQVVFCQDLRTGLKAIIAIHSTALGPALGGTRFYPYVDERAALTDVLRLSRGMTYKAAIAGLKLGGGKAVIIGEPARLKTPALLEAYGRFVETLNGRYITAGDVNTTSEDMDIVGRTTAHVVARTPRNGGSGDSAPLTALGVFHAMAAAAETYWGTADLTGRKIGVEGVGKVGYNLVGLLVDAGAIVSATDTNTAALGRLAAAHPSVSIVDSVIDADIDLYAPCAMGATLTDVSAAGLIASVVCGAANNQLAHPDVELALHQRGILWVPDFVANSGGLIQVAGELDKRSREETTAQVEKVGDTVGRILQRQREHQILVGEAARDIVIERLRSARTPGPLSPVLPPRSDSF
ncbi:Glu/Leu/Phe/Val dehydrogenase dimerization domain-containing protein [Nocardia sp. NPDC005998]|uniref:Glu/Leu/Phe/Val family dehydrogenase n=1 Tax=Nocardia sp. NPDC005998 TaxID=3156894 RepID=UPI0033A7594C